MAVEIVTDNEPEESPEEGVEVESADEVEVHGDVETIEEGDVTEVEEGDTNVTVIDSDSDAVEAVVTEQVIDDAVTIAVLTERFTQLESRFYQIEGELSAMRAVEAVEAEAIAEVVDDIEDIEEDEEDEEGEAEAEDEEDREPNSAGVHPHFRSWRDWFKSE